MEESLYTWDCVVVRTFFTLVLGEKLLLVASCEKQQHCFRASYRHNRQPLETQLSLLKPGNPVSLFCEQSGQSV